jgi:hypothetical protein
MGIREGGGEVWVCLDEGRGSGGLVLRLGVLLNSLG